MIASNDSARCQRRRLIVATTIGNALEFFDFTVFGFLAFQIGRNFFPSASGYGQLLLSVATFGVGFLMRPLGGVVIGAYADRAGRKKAMTLTIFMMAVGCALMASVPPYSRIGIAAPVLVVLARLIQGFSAGGEVGASTTLLVERANPANRGYMSSWQLASQGLGVFAGAALVGLLTQLLTPQAMDSWGWRVPFLLGMSIAPVGLYIRRRLDESLAPAATQAPVHPADGVRAVFGRHRRALFGGVLTGIGGTVAVYTVSFFIPAYAIRELGIAPAVALSGAALSGLIGFGLAPVVGRWSDKVARKRLIVWGRIALVALIYPALFCLNAAPSASVLLAVMGALHVVISIQAAPGLALLTEQFPMHVRASGISLVYSVGVGIFGGFSPFVATWLVHATGNNLAPAWYLIAITAISSLGLPWLDDMSGRRIDETRGRRDGLRTKRSGGRGIPRRKRASPNPRVPSSLPS
jgi:MHS family proline/betaine transporter-like MFS transporter